MSGVSTGKTQELGSSSFWRHLYAHVCGLKLAEAGAGDRKPMYPLKWPGILPNMVAGFQD